MTDKTVGIIGIGLLGTALARRLVDSGFSLIGYDPDEAAAERLKALGGTSVLSTEEVAAACRRVLFSLPAPLQVLQTVDQIEPHLARGSIILDTTTGDPEAVEHVAQRLAERDVAYMDCEIGGSSRQAAAGEAIVICGGAERAFTECSDILSAISSRVFRMGEAGTGTRMKLALNIAIGLHRAVLAESLTFARCNGIDPVEALRVLQSGPAYSKAMDIKGRKMIEGEFTPEARLAQHLKDVRLILKTGETVGSVLPLSAAHERLLSDAMDLGLGAEDNSAIIKVYAHRIARGQNKI